MEAQKCAWSHSSSAGPESGSFGCRTWGPALAHSNHQSGEVGNATCTPGIPGRFQRALLAAPNTGPGQAERDRVLDREGGEQRLLDASRPGRGWRTDEVGGTEARKGSGEGVGDVISISRAQTTWTQAAFQTVLVARVKEVKQGVDSASRGC